MITPTSGGVRDTLTRIGVPTWVVPYPIWSRGELLRWRHRLWAERRRAHDRLIASAHTLAPQIVHGDCAVAPYLVEIATTLGIPSVVHVRGPVPARQIRHLKLDQATALIAIGPAYRDDLVSAGVPADRICVIADATDVDRFRPRHDAWLRQQDPSIAPDDVLFGIVGRIAPFKRQLDFLRAAERVLAAGHRARFFVIGARNPNRPWYGHRVRRFPAARRIDRSVTFTGHRDDMDRVMASLDVLVTLSGGSVMIEAMACGVPVVTASARSPASLQIVRDGDSGRVVPANDPQALARVMSQLCEDAEQRRRLGANGRRRAEALFGCDRLVRETARLYDRLLANSPIARGLPNSRLEVASQSGRRGT